MLDPITIAAAYKACTTAIDLAKKGVELYKQIKSTSGDVSDVLKDLKEQYNKIVSPSKEQTKQYNEEVKNFSAQHQAPPKKTDAEKHKQIYKDLLNDKKI